MIDIWVNNGSGWNVELIESQNINISTYRPLSESFYINWPVDLKIPKKGVINIKKKDSKSFWWCDLRHINFSRKHPETITRIIKMLLKILTMMELSSKCKKKILTRLKWKTIYALTFLVMKMGWFFQFMFQIKHLENLSICYF